MGAASFRYGGRHHSVLMGGLNRNQHHALGYAPGETLRSENAEREAVPVAGDGER
jgi:hypothetical protein